MNNIDNKLKQLLSKDELPFEADMAIQQQLNYHMQLKASSSKVKQNSFVPFLAGIFSAKLIGWKVSILSIAFFAMIGYKQINNNHSNFNYLDTANVSESVDTVGFSLCGDTLGMN